MNYSLQVLHHFHSTQSGEECGALPFSHSLCTQKYSGIHDFNNIFLSGNMSSSMKFAFVEQTGFAHVELIIHLVSLTHLSQNLFLYSQIELIKPFQVLLSSFR